jgi:hypothetical protein
LLGVIVEGDLGDLAGRDLAVHGAQVAERAAVRGCRDRLRPFLVHRLGRGIVADLAGAVLDLGGGDAEDKTLRRVDLGDWDVETQHGNSLDKDGGRHGAAARTGDRTVGP